MGSTDIIPMKTIPNVKNPKRTTTGSVIFPVTYTKAAAKAIRIHKAIYIFVNILRLLLSNKNPLTFLENATAMPVANARFYGLSAN